MLFNSFEFLFVFLPITLAIYAITRRLNHVLSLACLVLASLFFYGWWNPSYIGLILLSALFNFLMGIGMVRAREGRLGSMDPGVLLFLSISVNLVALGYFKYSGFLCHQFLSSEGSCSGFAAILPLGISFFTFTQIAFLVDTARGKVKEFDITKYLLFVTYFPHLIAGPVLHHADMIPQFGRNTPRQDAGRNLAIGLTIFAFGLFKKVVIADPLSFPVGVVFTPGTVPTLVEAWVGALCYTMQIYFDFSGYSDMAIGASWLFGVSLPINFNSPYKAGNIIEFWRRWHISLSSFLRDYLYIPLGGGRHGSLRRHANLMATMLLGGLWHGAGWTFLLWGGIHGVYLVINHLWRRLAGDQPRSLMMRGMGRCLTFLAVMVAWVVFRAADIPAALAVLKGMLGLNGVVLPPPLIGLLGPYAGTLADAGVHFDIGLGRLLTGEVAATLVASAVIAWWLPNTQEIVRNSRSFQPANRDGTKRWTWSPNLPWLLTSIAAVTVSLMKFGTHSEFLYFQF